MTEKPRGRRTCLYTPTQLDAIVGGMARQAAGLLTGRTKVAIVGILRRGAPLADRLHARLTEAWGLAHCVRLDLMISRYADDLTLPYPETRLTENPTHAALDLADHTVLVVDLLTHNIIEVTNREVHVGFGNICRICIVKPENHWRYLTREQLQQLKQTA